MKLKKRIIKVTQIHGELGRCHVESWDEPKYPHLVDLLENDGNGECDCLDFTTRCLPNLRQSRKTVEYGQPGHPNPDRTRCKHIHVSIQKFTNEILQALSRQERGRKAKGVG